MDTEGLLKPYLREPAPFHDNNNTQTEQRIFM